MVVGWGFGCPRPAVVRLSFLSSFGDLQPLSTDLSGSNISGSGMYLGCVCVGGGGGEYPRHTDVPDLQL